MVNTIGPYSLFLKTQYLKCHANVMGSSVMDSWEKCRRHTYCIVSLRGWGVSEMQNVSII